MTLKRDTSLDEAVEREMELIRDRARRAEALQQFQYASALVQKAADAEHSRPPWAPLPRAVFEALGSSGPRESAWLFPDGCQIEFPTSGRKAPPWGYHVADEGLIQEGVRLVNDGIVASAREASLQLATRAKGRGTPEARATRLARQIKARLKLT